jgi:uncharacterized membrane protein (UPF0136 family)
MFFNFLEQVLIFLSTTKTFKLLNFKGSVPSLAAGLIFGAAATFGAYQSSINSNNIHVNLVTSGLLLTVMGLRFYKSKKFMPAGMIAGLSLLQFGRISLNLIQQK